MSLTGIGWVGSLDEQFFREVRGGNRLVMTSVFADPIHCGHVRLIQEAATLGDKLVVVVNGDEAAIRKKGYRFQSIDERLEIVAAIRGVDYVVPWPDDDVVYALLQIRPHVFAKGGDRSSPEQMNPDELYACDQIGCKVVYGVGGSTKIQSSSSLVKEAHASYETQWQSRTNRQAQDCQEFGASFKGTK